MLPPEVKAQLMADKGWGNLLLLAGDWLLITGAMLLCNYFFHPALYVLTVIFIGGRMMGFWSLLHEGNHYMLVPGNKPVNDLLTRLVIAWPLFKSQKETRAQHAGHHKYLGTPNDPVMALKKYPEFQFPMPKWRLYLIFLLDLTGVNFLRYSFISSYRYLRSWLNRRLQLIGMLREISLQRLIFYLSLAAIFTLFHLWDEFLLFWAVPYITWYSFLFRLVLLADHYFPGEQSPYQTRTVKLNLFEQWFMVPHNLNYHHEHHTYGNIPCYRLEKLHRYLMQDESYRRKTCVANGYYSVIKQLAC